MNLDVVDALPALEGSRDRVHAGWLAMIAFDGGDAVRLAGAQLRSRITERSGRPYRMEPRIVGRQACWMLRPHLAIPARIQVIRTEQVAAA